jgi:peptidoglycan/xylan/chitin deacetylase (PgdA/CDA1 family)
MARTDRYAYSAIVDRKPMTLPRGARVAVWTIVNVEEWDITKPMARTVLPPPGGGANPIPDVPNFSWFEYGLRVGFWRLKAVLDRHRVKATVSLNGSVCKSYPRIVEAAVKSGWEMMGHSYIQRPTHLEEDQQGMIRKTITTIKETAGKAPRGWMGPGLTETWETPDLLAAEGIEYVCDWVNDDQPYEMRVKTGRLVSLPYTVEINDIPIFLLQHHPAEELFRRAKDQFDTLYAEGKTNARIMAIAVHPYVSGVPHRIKSFDKIFRYLKKHRGVLFWKGEEILDWFDRQTGR